MLLLKKRLIKPFLFSLTVAVILSVCGFACAELRVGEKLTYNVSIGIFSAGTQIAHVREKTTIDSRDIYVIVSQTRTNGFFSIFYKINNTVYSYLDRESFSLRKFDNDINESNFARKDSGILDLENGKAYINWGSCSETINIPVSVLSVATLPYYLREIALSVDQHISLSVLTDRGLKQYDAVVDAKEKIRTNAGSFDAYRIVENKEKIKVWISDDSKRLPVKISVGTNFGEIVGVLEKIE